MLPVQETKHVETARELLIDQFKGRAVIQGYLDVLSRRVQEIENVLWDIIEKRRLDVATGVQLDGLGRLVGERRIGRGDVDYRTAIRLRIRVNRSKGRIVDIIDVAMLAGGAIVPRVTEYAFLGFQVELYGQTGERYIADLLSRTRAATSYGVLVASDLARGALLIYDDAVVPEAGIQTFADAISGGRLCASAYGLPSDFTGIVLAVAAPTLTGVAPTSGATAGGTAVTLTGTNLSAVTGVTFAGVSATSVVPVGPTTVTCVAPAHAAGAVDVSVTTPGGSATLVGGFTYSAVAPAPAIASVNKGYTRAQGGILLTITGTNFVSGAAVAISGTACPTVTFVSATTLTVITPVKASGVYNVVVTNPDAQTSGTSGNGLVEYVTPASIFGANLKRHYSETYAAGVWTDASGTANTSQATAGKRPTASTLTGTTDRPATHVALSFDGVDDGLNAGGAADIFTTAGTVGVIVQPTVSQNGESNIVSKNFNAEAYIFAANRTPDATSKPCFGCGGSVDAQLAIGATSINDNAVHRMIGTITSGPSTSTLYVDGTTAAANTGTGALTTGTIDCNAIGCAMSSTDATTDYHYTGKIAEVVIADVVASSTQRAKLDAYLRDCAGQAT